MASDLETLAPGFLIASPMLKDPNFDKTVVLMCVHNEEGAMGLVINRPSPLTMQDILSQLDLDCTEEITQPAMVGGPVALDSGLLLYVTEQDQEKNDNELEVTDELRLCPDRDMLRSIGLGEGPRLSMMFLGHSGWGPGQLEVEISKGAWIPVGMRLELVFDTPVDDRWDECLSGEGLNPGQIGFFSPKA